MLYHPYFRICIHTAFVTALFFLCAGETFAQGVRRVALLDAETKKAIPGFAALPQKSVLSLDTIQTSKAIVHVRLRGKVRQTTLIRIFQTNEQITPRRIKLAERRSQQAQLALLPGDYNIVVLTNVVKGKKRKQRRIKNSYELHIQQRGKGAKPLPSASPKPTTSAIPKPTSSAKPSPSSTPPATLPPQPPAPPLPQPTATPTPFPTPSPTATPNPTIEPLVPQWTLDNRVIQKNGKDFFPFGIYHITHYSSGDARRLNDMHTIAGLGMNMIHTPVDSNDKPMLDLAVQLKLEVAVEFNGVPENLIQQYGGHKAIAFLDIFDDVDQYTSGTTQYRWSPNYVASRTAQIKALLPRSLTYITGGWPQRMHNFVGRSDLVAQQGYPIPYEALATTTNIYMKPLSIAAPAAGQGFFANLQTFGWNGTARYPTARELRNMTYQTLLLGAHGILYYAFYDASNDLNSQPSLLVELKKMSAEVKVLHPVFLRGIRTSLSTGHNDVFAASWRYMGQLYIIVANASETQAKSVSLTLPVNASAPAVNIFPTREGSLSLSGGKLNGSLQARDVQVFQLGYE